MKFYISFLFCLSSALVFAQQTRVDDTRNKNLTFFLDTVQVTDFRSQKIDSLKGKVKSKADTLQLKKARFEHKLDSLNPKSKFDRYSQKFDSAGSSVTSKVERVNPQHKIDRYNKKLDSVQSRLFYRVDSLSRLNLQDISMLKSLDSLKLTLDSLMNAGPVKDLKKAEQQLSDFQAGINKRVNKVEDGINEKLGLFSKNGANLPGTVNLPNANLKSNLNVPGVKLPSTNLNASLAGKLNTSDLKINEKDILIDPKLPKAEVGLTGDAKKQMGKLRGRAKEKLPSMKSVEGVKDVQTNLGKVNEISGKVKGYQGDIKNIAEGNLDEVKQLPQEIENKVASMAQVQGIDGQANQYKELMAKWNSDPAVARELALNKAKELAVNHFLGHEEQLKLAMGQLSRVKAKQKDAEVIIDLFKKPENAMKSKTFVERLLPGFNLQVQYSSHLWLDFNPFIGYRWTSRWTTGIGWNERLSMNVKKPGFISGEHAYGPRSYIEFKVRENFHVKAEAEFLTPSESPPRDSDEHDKSNRGRKV